MGLCFVLTGMVVSTCSKNPPLEPQQGGSLDLVLLANLESIPEVLAPGGNAVIQALVLDESGAPVSGQGVEFSTNLGTLAPAISTTNDSGVAVTMFTAPQKTGIADITARLDSFQIQSVAIEVKDAASQSIAISADQTSLLANGISSTNLSSTWRNEKGEPLKGIAVVFETTLGKISFASATTDSFGVARATLVSAASRVDTFAQVRVQSDTADATTLVVFRGIRFTLEAVPRNLIADGKSSAKIKVILKETTNNVAIPGAEITFGASLGTIPSSSSTNSSGIAEVSLASSSETGVATITATYGETLTEVIQINFSESVPTNLSVSANPTVIPADNQSHSNITAAVTDQTNNPVADGTVVQFEIVDGSGAIESNKVTVDGVAVSKLTSSKNPDTVTVVVRVDQLTDTTAVRFVVGEASAISLAADSLSLPADGKTSTRVTAQVFDRSGNPVVNGTKVNFETNIGEVTPVSQTQSGLAVASFSSSVTGTATIKASVGSISSEIHIQLRSGPPNSILLNFDPNTLGVKDSGRNQTTNITATVLDSKGNAVSDGTQVAFSIFSSPGGGEVLSNSEPIPTLNGNAQVSLNSGIRSGSVRILAQVTDSLGVPIVPEVRAVSTEIIIFAGPPFIEDVNDPNTSHLTVGAAPLNVWGWHVVNNTVTVTAVVGDKFNNPVTPGTAVFFTTTGGVISTYTGFTDQEGVATVTLHTAQPYPTITRYYNTFFDPNENHPDFNLGTNVIPGPIPDFEGGQVLNSVGNFGENDGIARILAVTEGVDSNGNSARAWSVTNLVFSGGINTFDIEVSTDTISPGESAMVTFEIYDVNGNPIVAGSEISIQASDGELSWTSLSTSDPGVTEYQVLLTNNLDPTDPEAQPTSTAVTITVKSSNGNVIKSSDVIHLTL